MSDLRKILAAATPGPWEADGAPWNRIVCSATNRVCFVAHSDGLNDERDIATSELVALAPDLAAEVLALRDDNAKLREALSGLRVTGPNSDGEVWLHYTCPRTGLSGGMNLGGPDRIAVKAFLRLQAALSDIRNIIGGGE